MIKKTSILIAVCLVCFKIIAQKTPIIEAKITGIEIDIPQKTKDYERARFIWNNNNGSDNISANDKSFLEMFEAKYPYFSEEEPWNIQLVGCSWYCGAMYEMSASSELKSSRSNNYSVNNLSDDDIRTAWVEGVKGYGIGEYIAFEFPYTAARANQCIIINGYAKDETTWKNNSRVKSFNVYEDDKLIATINLKDTRAIQEFNLPHPIPHRPDNYNRILSETSNQPAVMLKFVIREVYKGNKYDDTAISEFIFDGLDVHCLAVGTQITMWNDTLKDVENIQVGDSVMSFNIATRSYVARKVKQVYNVLHSRMLRITLANDMQILTTYDHPFLSITGWKSFDPERTMNYKRYDKVESYKIGDNLSYYDILSTSYSQIKSIESIDVPIQTYTLMLDGEGAFIANSFLVGQE